jgi:hypothetical protein
MLRRRCATLTAVVPGATQQDQWAPRAGENRPGASRELRLPARL